MTLKSDFQPFQELSQLDQQLHQSMCVLELANMIGNITNALNFELKSAALKNRQISELEVQLENARIRSQNAIEENEMNMMSTRQELE